ncbi:MAG: hypothetical protein LLG44_11050 [Chloroflexi bacterium]|nr:hypothetical protein [Chloroflexota bacterium]
MKYKNILAAALILALVCGLVGCSNGGQASGSPTAATSETSAKPSAESKATTAQGESSKATAKPTVEPEEPTSDSEQVDTSELQSLENMDSYHLVQSGSFTDVLTDGTSTVNTIDVEVWEVREPQASHTVWIAQKDDEPESSFEFIIIGSDAYLKSSDTDEWMAMTSSEESTSSFGDLGWFTDPTSVMSGDAELVGKEQVNGLATKHYRYTGASVVGSYLGTGGTIEQAQADVWVSEEYNIVVKYDSHWKGTAEDGTQHDWSFASEVSEVNEPITIEPPEGVAKPGLPDDVALMEGATEVTSFSGITSFKVAATVDEAMAFYAQSLVDSGWEAGEDSGIPGMATYTKDTRSLSLMAVEDGDQTGVTIMITEQ